MLPTIRNWTRDEMMKRVAFFKDLKGSKGGLRDSNLPDVSTPLTREMLRFMRITGPVALRLE